MPAIKKSWQHLRRIAPLASEAVKVTPEARALHASRPAMIIQGPGSWRKDIVRPAQPRTAKQRAAKAWVKAVAQFDHLPLVLKVGDADNPDGDYGGVGALFNFDHGSERPDHVNKNGVFFSGLTLSRSDPTLAVGSVRKRLSPPPTGVGASAGGGSGPASMEVAAASLSSDIGEVSGATTRNVGVLRVVHVAVLPSFTNTATSGPPGGAVRCGRLFSRAFVVMSDDDEVAQEFQDRELTVNHGKCNCYTQLHV